MTEDPAEATGTGEPEPPLAERLEEPAAGRVAGWKARAGAKRGRFERERLGRTPPLHGRGGPPFGWHGEHGPDGRPPWWPEDEPWPPAAPPWQRRRRKFLLRIGIVILVFFFLAVIGPIVLIWHLLTGFGVPGAVAGPAAVFGPTLILWGIARLAGGFRGVAAPMGDLVDAAGRVEAGDYSARVPEPRRGPREVRSVTRAFNEMAARLENDERQRRTLLADISHEFRTPLAVLQGELEAIVDGVHPADEAHLAATLEETRVLTRLVEDLRTMALADAGVLALHREPADLAVLASEVVDGFETIAEGDGIVIELAASDELPILELDPVRIRQVLANLLANALRYAPRGSAVTVRLEPTSGGGARVAVCDAGPGIPPDLLPRVFERFAKSADSGGSGLGLAIARQLVEAHGGTITAESQAAGGTTLAFVLPAS